MRENGLSGQNSQKLKGFQMVHIMLSAEKIEEMRIHWHSALAAAISRCQLWPRLQICRHQACLGRCQLMMEIDGDESSGLWVPFQGRHGDLHGTLGLPSLQDQICFLLQWLQLAWNHWKLRKLRPMCHLVEVFKRAVKVHIHGHILKADSLGLHALFPIEGPLVLLQPWSQSDEYPLAATTEMMHKVEYGFSLNIVVKQCFVITQLFAAKDEPLLLRWNTCQIGW